MQKQLGVTFPSLRTHWLSAKVREPRKTTFHPTRTNEYRHSFEQQHQTVTNHQFDQGQTWRQDKRPNHGYIKSQTVEQVFQQKSLQPINAQSRPSYAIQCRCDSFTLNKAVNVGRQQEKRHAACNAYRQTIEHHRKVLHVPRERPQSNT